MRRQIVAGNWKMNLEWEDALALINGLEQYKNDSVELVVAPPSLYLSQLAQDNNSPLILSAQNCHHETSGAFTGEVSASMLASLGLKMCIVGHSERRQYQGETDETIAQKVNQLHHFGVEPILCVGESLEVRKSGEHLDFVANQMENVLKEIDQTKPLIVAYEPVWAIGTGETATPDQAQEMHAHLRKRLVTYGYTSTSILYGGSCKPGNAKELFSMPDIDGGLIGGASLKAESFLEIAASF